MSSIALHAATDLDRRERNRLAGDDSPCGLASLRGLAWEARPLAARQDGTAELRSLTR